MKLEPASLNTYSNTKNRSLNYSCNQTLDMISYLEIQKRDLSTTNLLLLLTHFDNPRQDDIKQTRVQSRHKISHRILTSKKRKLYNTPNNTELVHLYYQRKQRCKSDAAKETKIDIY
ncbi:uncharacterized protein N7506_003899 [Penicillium brevicompactum]|uniref:uncharacterized protein n=1 Tax=Penicillium brevicompactum TaxID=5074 RepID=UPI002541FF26|nr:uncharacterized protein N7506_003899 [Penicillium brevicompactum]KAJ5335877.1 hypothetical protein N7506_003899 [Penicillium brevicompactum]